jgi:hypothetical protein
LKQTKTKELDFSEKIVAKINAAELEPINSCLSDIGEWLVSHCIMIHAIRYHIYAKNAKDVFKIN